MWWESLLLLTAYFGYVVFMKFNVQVERWVKQMINRNKVVKVTAPEAQPKVGGSGCLFNVLLGHSSEFLVFEICHFLNRMALGAVMDSRVLSSVL